MLLAAVAIDFCLLHVSLPKLLSLGLCNSVERAIIFDMEMEVIQ